MKNRFWGTIITFITLLLSGCSMLQTDYHFGDDYSCSNLISEHENDSHLKESENMNSAYSLIVNDTSILCSGNLLFNYDEHYVELPIIAVVKALGATIEWENDTTASIALHDRLFILDTTNNSLCERNKFRNYIALPPGATHGGCYRLEDNEYFVDSDSLREFIKQIGAEIEIDYLESIVVIKYK